MIHDEKRAREVHEANERISAAMMGMIPGAISTVETELSGGLVSQQTFVKCSYSDLRVVLAAFDAAFAHPQPTADGMAEETVARLLCEQRGISPETLYQVWEGEDWPADGYHDFPDHFNERGGETRRVAMTKAWRRRVPDAKAIIAALATPSIPADSEALVEWLRIEIERQCGIGAGDFSIDRETGLWEIGADLDPHGLANALSTQQAPARAEDKV